MAAVTSCENALFKYARAVKQKVWNESQNRERDWGDVTGKTNRKTSKIGQVNWS